MNVRKLKLFLSILASLASVLLYQNCAPMEPATGLHLSSVREAVTYECGDIEGLFAVTYRPFLQQKCSTCHYSGGPGNGTFADANFALAYNSFQSKGYTLISQHATNPGHNGGVTGSRNGGNDAEIARLQEAWTTGIAESQGCGGGTGGTSSEPIGARINTTNKTIGITGVGQTRTIQWNLNTELTASGPVPVLPSALLTIDVQLVSVLGQVAYYFTNPRIRNSTVDIHLESLRVIVNGSYVAGETTFNFVDRDIYKGTDALISAGTMVALGQSSQSDTLALSFGKLESVVLPPPADLPVVQFAVSQVTAAGERGMYQAAVALNAAASSAVVVNVNLDLAASAKVRRSPRDTMYAYDYFDWDATLGTVAQPVNNVSLTFVPGGPITKTIDLLISDDDRQEAQETARLRITSVSGGVIGTNATFSLIIPNDAADVIPVPTNPFDMVVTYSDLMKTGGVLQKNCLSCHNTVDMQGGYDMTDYYSMTSFDKGIIVPGTNWLQSKMIERLRMQGAGRMPLDQALDADDQRLIEEWIKDGAKNN